MTTLRTPQPVIPITPVLDGEELTDVVPWARKIQGMLDQLTQSLVDTFTAQSRAYTPRVVEVTADYTTTGERNEETVICNNTGSITVTLHTLVAKNRVTVIRAGTGAVTVDGDAANISGAGTQSLAAQYDAVDMVASTTEWLKK
jgi:hypothetical protein